ncbi:hypothetical protein Leryth_010367 [Lithospermum erythrorhizon]|nr:hypothetical protein Leryth_010367 [Lithospermum erythrorhizon]
MGITMGLNLLLLVAMVATNILSLYHLSSTLHSPPPSTHPTSPPPTPPYATISHLTRLHPPSTLNLTTPSDLLLYTHLSPIASACKNYPQMLHQYMNYTPFSTCPNDAFLAESLILRGCHPLPRRRCFSTTTTTTLKTDPFAPLPENSVNWKLYTSCKSFTCLAKLKPEMGFDMKLEKTRFLEYKSELDLPISQLFELANNAKSVIRLGVDIGGGSGTFAAQMKLKNVSVVTTTMNLGAPYNEAVALRGLVPLHVPLQQRLPMFDGVVDLVRCGRAVNRWIPLTMLEFLLYDVDRVLRGGGYFFIDHFFSKSVDLGKVYGPLIGKLGYKKVKWAVSSKTDSNGIKNGEVYLTALLQKPLSK